MVTGICKKKIKSWINVPRQEHNLGMFIVSQDFNLAIPLPKKWASENIQRYWFIISYNNNSYFFKHTFDIWTSLSCLSAGYCIAF